MSWKQIIAEQSRLPLGSTSVTQLCTSAITLQCLPWSPNRYRLQISTPSLQNMHAYANALLTTFLSLPKPFMGAHRPSSAGVGLPLPQTSTSRVHHRLCVCVCSQTDLASSLGARHTAHNTHRCVPHSSFQPLFSFLFYFFDSPLPSTGSVTWDASGKNPLCWNVAVT